ncbi:hypothetical protein [Phenylobacterium deserti]|uniref:Uncharacterized protein n=1 Tax=Phenylobacterium deserti TaxID=1914756 RepID=A0A328AT83_9CAUL|nr:hypothetical protein [Phenylobacterium deserti]RAK57471.1 hypothetical protein DJ018_05895 [Phenylobacterium deserti]
MADEREEGTTGQTADTDKVQTDGRQANGAQALNAGSDNGGVERYPSVRQDDAVEATGRTEQVTGESRSFDASADASTPEGEQAPPDASVPPSANEGRLGPGADPVEGAR